ncbi:Immunoglobulin subtype,Immunoglobulin-like domain,Immunoglobulin-like fold,Immunoglobulin subtype [Cinara cedri]|uniref:Immunoglobulin subtype,Immunoglobulin-like domain,Immunoglobulin-like fold,Immunoglobulin subtype n=1 Tax=Cinara cedri TaxID=506608 RepID=A0A5E4MHL8_9HEMI|nr:Immunoglobulin subtype,Immunoglobulin-like domain,Immunoglobulin-like fold,Immunoglobulin subtype [Cinara cedri]
MNTFLILLQEGTENISTTQTSAIDANFVEENHHQHEVGSKWSPAFEDGPGPDNVTARFGSTVQLDCKIQLLYDKTVTWVHRKADDIQLLTVGRQVHSSDQRISLSFRYPNNWRLQIVYINDRDDGVYECQVATHPPTTKKTYLKVDVPTVRMSVASSSTSDLTRGGNDFYYKTGSTLEIVCKVVHEGTNNGSKVSWYRGRQTISAGITEKTTSDSSCTTIVSTLKIKHVQKKHSGNYTCLVGSPSASAAVTIHILNGEQPAAVHDGNSGPLVCCVAGWWLLTLCCLVLSS